MSDERLWGDSVYGAVLRHDEMTVKISLGESISYPETNLTPDEIEILGIILAKLRNRNFSIAVPGWLFDGYVMGAAIQPHPDHESPELVLSIQL